MKKILNMMSYFENENQKYKGILVNKCLLDLLNIEILIIVIGKIVMENSNFYFYWQDICNGKIFIGIL